MVVVGGAGAQRARRLIAVFVLDPAWYDRCVIPEGYGVLELVQFIIMLVALAIAVRLLFKPFVRKRPFLLTFTILSALSCLYIAGEEMSWGQHFFHWNTPEYWALVNRQGETNLHNTYAVFEKWPRAILEIGVFIGGILVPLAAAFDPRVRANRLSLFLPAAALMPTAIAVFVFKFLDRRSAEGFRATLVAAPERDHRALSLHLHIGVSGRVRATHPRNRDGQDSGQGPEPEA